MEPAHVRALWFREKLSRAWEHRRAADPAQPVEGSSGRQGGICLCYVDGGVRNRFHLQLNPTPAPLQCHFALHLGVSPGAL